MVRDSPRLLRFNRRLSQGQARVPVATSNRVKREEAHKSQVTWRFVKGTYSRSSNASRLSFSAAVSVTGSRTHSLKTVTKVTKSHEKVTEKSKSMNVLMNYAFKCKNAFTRGTLPARGRSGPGRAPPQSHAGARGSARTRGGCAAPACRRPSRRGPRA